MPDNTETVEVSDHCIENEFIEEVTDDQQPVFDGEASISAILDMPIFEVPIEELPSNEAMATSTMPEAPVGVILESPAEELEKMLSVFQVPELSTNALVEIPVENLDEMLTSLATPEASTSGYSEMPIMEAQTEELPYYDNNFANELVGDAALVDVSNSELAGCQLTAEDLSFIDEFFADGNNDAQLQTIDAILSDLGHFE